MDYKEKAIKVTDDILSAVGKKDDPIKETISCTRIMANETNPGKA